MPQSSIDPLRARLLELSEQIQEHTVAMRDFAATPGNAWLAKAELQQVTSLLGDIEALLEDIKQSDAESGY